MGNSNNGNRSNVDRELGRMDSEYNPYLSALRGSNNDFGRNESLRDEALAGFRSGTSNGLGSPSMMNGSSFGGDVNFDPAKLGNYGSAREGYEDFARSGGVDATAMRRANTIIPSFYDAYKRNAQNRRSVQGGYAPGFDAQMAEIGRQAGREGFNASRQTEGDIARLTQQGRLAGLSGLMGLGNAETGLNQFNTGLGTQVAEGNANRRQSANQFDRGFDEDTRRWNADFGEGQRRFNSQGIASLYGQDVDNYYRNLDMYLAGIGGRSGNAQNLIYNRTEPTSRLGSLVGGAANLGLGLIGMGGRRRPQVTGPWEAGGGG